MAKKKIPATKTATKKSAAKKAAIKKASADTSQFPAVFARLKAILKPYAPRMVVVKDDNDWYYLDTKLTGKNKRPIMFAAVRAGKNYVSYYLMCSYCNPELIENTSPELKKRMQGKACFNFSTVNEQLFSELKALTKTSTEWFLNGGLEKILKMQSTRV